MLSASLSSLRVCEPILLTLQTLSVRSYSSLHRRQSPELNCVAEARAEVGSCCRTHAVRLGLFSAAGREGASAVGPHQHPRSAASPPQFYPHRLAVFTLSHDVTRVWFLLLDLWV